MPTYEYRYKRCGYTSERLQPILTKPVRRCPECGGSLKRLIGRGIGLIFKGSGSYKTDYKRKSETPKKPQMKSAEPEKGS